MQRVCVVVNDLEDKPVKLVSFSDPGYNIFVTIENKHLVNSHVQVGNIDVSRVSREIG